MTVTPKDQEPVDQACEYANLIAEVCKLSSPADRQRRELEARVFERLGFNVIEITDGRYLISADGNPPHLMPQILKDFGTAVRFTIGHKEGTLDGPLEENWYVREMCQTNEGKIAAWAVRLHKFNSPYRDATAISPAAALVAAWLRAHP